ncbi:OsmC family protein [Paralimibaculum aggregatum]|uniref:OsmC family protein n=1 Tax=Paralimibaculum aggregatum TaxID=3036245 RepID=A0ABQ6LF91_9RHOB|nr:OsmC family protein [Limibaculum sp. NKW23]GMG82005.1 OsmC family protein [Limibaculum sp. NKW23]
MPALTVQFRRLETTRAAVGWAGVKAIIADRPKDLAGGMGLGLSGGELQALALGAGFCNQLQLSAEALGLEITALEVDVDLAIEGDLLAGATIRTRLATAEGEADTDRLLAHAEANSTISNSCTRGFPVTVARR